MGSRVLYEERSGWPWWVHVLILPTFIALVLPLVEFARGNVGAERAMPVWVALLLLFIGLGFPIAFYSLVGQLRTRIVPDGVNVCWGLAEIIKKMIPFGEIESAESVTYSPLGEFGGWGIRAARKKKRAWTISGNRAVLLTLRDGTRFYLGSERPDRILQWLTSEMRSPQ
jgi:hypothetical protein